MKIKSFYITASFACLFMLTSRLNYKLKYTTLIPQDVLLDDRDNDETIEG